MGYLRFVRCTQKEAEERDAFINTFGSLMVLLFMTFVMMLVFDLNGWKTAGKSMMFVGLFEVAYIISYVISQFAYHTVKPARLHAILWMLGVWLSGVATIDFRLWGERTGFFIGIFVVPYLLWRKLKKYDK